MLSLMLGLAVLLVCEPEREIALQCRAVRSASREMQRDVGPVARSTDASSAPFSPAFVEGWTVAGSPAQCIAELSSYFEAGVGHMALRLTSWEQRGQLTRFLNEVAPAFGVGRS